LGRFVVVLATLVLVLLVHGPASAVPPLEVPGQITDEAAALGTGAAAAREAVDELAADDDVNLYAAFVPSFDGADADDWAQRTALLSELDESDILLAVAMSEETYEYGWWVNESFPLSEVDVENVISDDVAPRMEAGDWSGAVVTLSEQLGSLVNEEEEASDSQWSATTTLLVVGGVAVVLLGAHLLSRRRTPADRRP
jgi:uncharacterized membrane protein YgcG